MKLELNLILLVFLESSLKLKPCHRLCEVQSIALITFEKFSIILAFQKQTPDCYRYHSEPIYFQ